MTMVVPVILQLVKLCVIGFVFTVQGSAGDGFSLSPANFPAIPPVEGTPAPFNHRKSFRSNTPSSASHPNGSNLNPLPAIPPVAFTPKPHSIERHAPSLSPSIPIELPPYNTAPPRINVPSKSPSTPIVLAPSNMAPPPPSTPTYPLAPPPSVTAPPPSIVPVLPSARPPSIVPVLPSARPPSIVPVLPSASPPPIAPVLPSAPPPSLAPVLPSAPPPSVVPGMPSAPPPLIVPVLPSAPPGKAPVDKSPISVPGPPVVPPTRYSPQHSPSTHSSMPGPLPPVAHARNASNNKAPITEPIAPVPFPPRNSREKSPVVPGMTPLTSPAPASSPTGKLPQNPPSVHPVMPGKSPSVLPDPDVPPLTPHPSVDRKRVGIPVAEPPYKIPKGLPPASHSPKKAPSTHKSRRHSNDAPIPPLSSPKSPKNNGYRSSTPPPSASSPKHHDVRNKFKSPAPAPSYFTSPTTSIPQGPMVPPVFVPTSRRRHHDPPPLNPVSHLPTVPSPSPTVASGQTEFPLSPPKLSPAGSSTKSPKMPLLPPFRAFPPPPPNQDCSTTICTEPYTNTPPGSPCGCVWPMQVGLRLSVALYTFFPLVSELAAEIAAGVFMKQSQVRIIGANAAQQPEKTVVLIDLVPLGEKFDNTTAFLTYERFWHKQVVIKSSYFGAYEVLYVRYPGLPPSPPSAPSSIGIIDDGPYSGNNGRTIKPEGVNVPKGHQKYGLSGGMIAIVVLSAFVAVVLCSAIAWFFLSKYKSHACQAEAVPQPLQQSHAKPSGAAGSMIGSGLDSASLSFGSSIATYTGSAKTFTTSEIEKATGKFDESRILGEGGFGRVYSGVLEDGTKVAVKVLKRDDQQGGREFLAEVEMLSRLHHRNLVKLIGICIEEQARCLVYELIPNGSVESHLHGLDKESAPLCWDARLKIALGAARALAYLHEDSSPRVIHRDFKASNILLEHDFTPKVSDFGLARTALDEESRHISTRVMGTFGYVAPEYAMTGHLLVKSDVYSYGVVLLELLTGRKPVDMTQLPGQENLVAWARPLLTSREGLQTITDPSLGNDVPFDSVAKVAAIASMCVQPEVQHRPFMGEVVQALKLVCNECDEAKEVGSGSSIQDDLSIDLDARVSTGSGQLPDHLPSHYALPNYDLGLDTERGLSVSDLFSSSARHEKEESGSLRRYSSSGPLRTGRGRQLWQQLRRLSAGTVSEHGAVFRLWPGSY
ncbi:Protein kinase [Melia azedarach]|uniref:Protein kinase n=1 Tax=Melia azedarach TaxID=155640 RepID=A0ACC1XBR9_MELAZ|nr:Protein kinase [Melia azedarach]